MPNGDFFTLRSAHVNCAIMAMLYTHLIGNQLYKTMVVFKCVIVYLARDIPPFVMYCVYGESGSSLLNRVYQLYDTVGPVVIAWLKYCFCHFLSSNFEI